MARSVAASVTVVPTYCKLPNIPLVDLFSMLPRRMLASGFQTFYDRDALISFPGMKRRTFTADSKELTNG